MRRLVLLYANDPVASVRNYFSAGSNWKWIYFGRNYARARIWEQRLRDEAQRLEIGDMIQETAERLKEPFLAELTRVGLASQQRSEQWQLAWWTSRISERNTMVSPLFLHCCYFEIASQLLGANTDDLCIIAESAAVLRSIARLGRSSGIDVVLVRPILQRIAAWSPPVRIGLGLGIFVVLCLWERICARLSSRGLSEPRPHQPAVLIHTYIDRQSLVNSGRLADRYFGALAEWLASKGYHVVTVPTIVRLHTNCYTAFRWLRRGQQRFLIPADWYRFSDYARAMANGIRQLFLIKGRTTIAGLDITDLVHEEAYRQIGSADLEDMMLALFIRRLAQNGFRFECIVHPFENHVAEKALNFAAQKYMPGAKRIGFQHGAIYTNWLCYCTTPAEAEFAPLPDRIVCNGPFFRQYLSEQNFPPERLMLGCSLRYQYLFDGRDTFRTSGMPNVVLLLPLEPTAAAELLAKSIQALQSVEEIEVSVKPHPMSSLGRVLNLAGLKELPARFNCTYESTPEVLSKASVAISSASTTLLEVVAAGKPVVIVGRDADLDMDPLGWWPDLYPVVRSVADIRDAALSALRMSDEQLFRYKDQSRRILQSCFTPFSEELMNPFSPACVAAEASP